MSTLSISRLKFPEKFADHKREKFQLKVVTRITILMCAGALAWTIGMIVIGAYHLLVLPIGYLFVSAISVSLCSKTKYGRIACDIQMSVSILFPCLFQLVAGGVMATGAVMLWSMVALFGLSTYTRTKAVRKWAAYTIVVVTATILYENTSMYTSGGLIDISPLKLLIFNSTSTYIVLFYVGFFFVNAVETTRRNLKTVATEASELNVRLENRNVEHQEGLILARDIQDAFLKTEDHLRTVFTKSFLMRKAKEHISGDFIWAEQKSHLKYIICGECNSKGTSRGLLAMLMVSTADKILRDYEYTDPGIFLTKFNEYIREDSGLDLDKLNLDVSLSMLIINAQTNKAKLATAGGRLMIKKLDQDLARYEAEDGLICCENSKSTFVSKDIDFEIGDIVYMFTDGFLNQKNKEGEPFGIDRFQDVLEELDTEYSFMQKRKLVKVLNQWQTKAEQSADVLVCGFEIEDPALVYETSDESEMQIFPR